MDDFDLEVEALPEQPRATLWPYRPKRQPDELVSSWLWRVARSLGAPPKRFVFDAIGSRLIDVDREISDTAIEQLALLSGQSREHLLGGTAAPRSTSSRKRGAHNRQHSPPVRAPDACFCAGSDSEPPC